MAGNGALGHESRCVSLTVKSMNKLSFSYSDLCFITFWLIYIEYVLCKGTVAMAVYAYGSHCPV